MTKKISILLMLLCLVPLRLECHNAMAETSPATDPVIHPKLDIVLVLDNSGSMRKSDPNFLTPEVVTNFVSGFGDLSRIGMVIFDTEPHLVEPLKALTGSVEKARFLKSLERINYKGQFSDSPAAIERAVYELKTNGRNDAEKIIILLTDGIVDTGNRQKDLEKERWLKDALALESKKENIRIIGIAFTDQADFSLIQALAFKTHGEYYRAYEAAEIQGVFEKINNLLNKSKVKPDPAIIDTVRLKTPEPEAFRPAAPVLIPAGPAPEPETTSIPNDNRLLVYILLGLTLFLGVIVIIVISNRKAKDIWKSGSVLGSTARAFQKVSTMPRAELIDVKNVTSKKTLRMEKPTITIGRDANNDITILKNTVSSLHATIEYRDNFFYLEDQRSKNKTFLNGEEVVPHLPKKLKSGDVVSFNIYKFIFLLPDLIPAGKTVMDFGGETEMTRTGGVPDTDPPPRASALPQAILIDIENITSKKTMKLEKTVTTIGRGIHNDINLPKTSISGSHATIEYKSDCYHLEDLRSRNKTALNGKIIEPHLPQKLKSGDEITFDIYKFIFLLERQTPAGDTEESL